MLSEEKAEFLRSLEDRNHYIDPQRVIAAARNRDCVLHDEFVWNKDEAAQQHWLDTARRLIKYVRMEYTIEETTIVAPVYVLDPTRPAKSQRYVTLTRASQDRAMAQQILLDELDRIGAAINRSCQVAAVLGLTGQLNVLLEDVTMLRTRAERRDAVEKSAPSLPRRRKKAA